MSEKGNYVLAVIRSGKSYETLAECLSDLIKEMQKLTNNTNLTKLILSWSTFLGVIGKS